MSMGNNSGYDDEVGYVSPADFDGPADAADGVKAKDEIDLPVLESVMIYVDRELAKLKTIDSLDLKDETFTIEQQLKVNKVISSKLELIRINIKATIEGIEVKYDER